MKSWKERVAAGSWTGAGVGERRQWALPRSLGMGVQASPVSPGSQVLSCRASTWEQEPSSQDTGNSGGRKAEDVAGMEGRKEVSEG